MKLKYDDNLKKGKRKRTNPIHNTYVLIIIGFLALGILMVYLLSDNPNSNRTNQANMDATVNARVNEIVSQQKSEEQPRQNTAVTSPTPTRIQPTVEPVQLIEGTNLQLNTVINGQITDELFEINYTYEGQAGTPIIITMQGIRLNEPTVILTNPYGNRIIASSTADQTIGDTDTQVIAAVLPVDGQYIVTATRRNGRVGDASGTFQLALQSPQSLSLTSEIQGLADSDTWQWYVANQPEPFYVVATLSTDIQNPEIGVYQLNAASKLVGISYLVSNGILGPFNSDEIYFIAVGQKTLQSNSVDVYTSPYTLTLSVTE